MSINLEDLGLTHEELQEKVIEGAVNALLDRTVRTFDPEEGEDEHQVPTLFKRAIEEQIGRRVDSIGATLEPKVNEIIKAMVFQRTTGWGEAQGKPFTFTEYMVDKHLHYEIENAMKQVLGGANKVFVEAFVAAIKLQLQTAAANLKLEVKTPR